VIKIKFYLTTAIDYVNARPHLGHAYEKICSDVIARWHRLRGDDTFFLTGTDENAQKNEQAAKKAKKDTKTFVEENTKVFKELCEKFNISNDYFIRTTQPLHFRVSQDIIQKAFDKGDIYKGYYEGYYCTGCEAFLTEKDLDHDKCPEHGTKPEWIKEENYFFKMSKYQSEIEKLLSKKGFVLPDYRRIEMLNRIKEEGLKDLSVSRVNLDWGIPVPFDKKHKIYVWFDALINYVSALDPPNGEKYKKYWPADVHVIGKGINWFHTVIWPTMLLSAGIPLPKSVYVHGYVNIKGKKLSKTTGVVVDPIDLAEKYGADAIRYFLIRDIPFGGDGDFSEEALKERINGELLSDLGNLASRVLTLAERTDKIEGTAELEKNLNFFIRSVNKYINQYEPWKLQGQKFSNVLYNLVESLRVISILIEPFIPETADKINKQLGIRAGSVKDLKFRKFTGKIQKGEHLFKKI
jgi:methionyl-tRNA synthetase